MVTVVMSPVFLLIVTAILVASRLQTLAPSLPFLATVRAGAPRAASGQRFQMEFLLHHAASVAEPGGPRSSREARGRGRDPLRDHRAIVGRDAHTPWYIRVRSLILLFLLVAGLGIAIAGALLLVIASGRFVLEVLAG
jgi:hypothetical protein